MTTKKKQKIVRHVVLLQDERKRDGGTSLVQRAEQLRLDARRGGTWIQHCRSGPLTGSQTVDHDASHRTSVLRDMKKKTGLQKTKKKMKEKNEPRMRMCVCLR